MSAITSKPILKQLGEYITSTGIDFPTIIKETGPLSSSENAIVSLASHLFNPLNPCWGKDDIMTSLDQENLKVAINAIEFKYTR